MNASTMNTPLLILQPGLMAACSERMTRLDQAKWHLAVLMELAQPGHITLAAVFDSLGQVIDFTCQEVSPTATLALGCAGDDLVGRTLKQVLVECEMDASVFAAYQTVFLQQQAQILRVDGPDGVTVHCISLLPAGLSVEISCVAAMDRMLAAHQTMRELE